MRFDKRNSILVVLGLVFFSLLNFCYSYSIMNNSHNWGGDFALYISQAKAIVNSNTNTLFEASKVSCEGSFKRMNPDVYPIVFPLMLSPIYAFLGVNFIAFKLLIIFCFVVVLFAVCFFMFKKIGAFEAVLVVGLLATSNFFIEFNNNVLADVPGMMWVWISILIYYFFDEPNLNRKLIKFSVLGFFLSITYHTKTLNISLIVAVFLFEIISYFKLKNTFKELVLKSTILLFVFGFFFIFIHIYYPSSSDGYIEQLSNLSFQTIKDNIIYYSNAPKWFLFYKSFFVWLTFPFVLLGIYSNFKKDIFLILLITTHILLLVLWPYQQGLRFLIYLVPLYYYFACIGYVLFFELLTQKTKIIKLYNLRFIIFFIIISYSFFNAWKFHPRYAVRGNDIDSKEAKELFEFVNTKTNFNDKFVFFKPNVLRLICDRESVYLLNSTSIKSSKASYWIYKKGDTMADTTGLKMLLNNNEFLVFKLK